MPPSRTRNTAPRRAPARPVAEPASSAPATNPLAAEALGVVTIDYRGTTLTVHPQLVDQARYMWELRVVGNDSFAYPRRLQAAQELLVLLFGEQQLDQLVRQHAGALSLDGATELLDLFTTAAVGASSGEPPAS